MKESPASARKTAALHSLERLRGKLGGVRRKESAVLTGTGIAAATTALVIAFATGMTLDWLIDLPRWVRALGLACWLSLAASILWKTVIFPLRHRESEDGLALLVEREIPDLRTRLIASLQLARAGSLSSGRSAALIRALIAETWSMAAPMDFQSVVKTRTLKRTSLVAILVLALAGTAWVRSGPNAAVLLRRAFLGNVPVPRKTQVAGASGNLKVSIGQEVELFATARGVIPALGRAVLRYDAKRVQEIILEPNPGNPSRFSRTLKNVQESFDYVIRLGDGTSETFHVQTLMRPVVTAVDCMQTFPAYTQLESVKRRLGDLSLLAGSKLNIRATASKELRAASIHLAGLDADVPAQITPQDPRELAATIDIPATGLTGFSVRVVDTDDLSSRQEAVYRIDIVPDRAPVVRITWPDRKEELVTQKATMLVGFEAGDDFGIGRVLLHYRDTEAAPGTEKAIEFDLAGQTPKTLARRYEWKLAALEPPPVEGTSIEFWVEVIDNNNATGPGVGVSEHHVARVVSEAEKRADLNNRLTDYFGTIREVAQDQERLNEKLGALILERAKP